MALNLEVLRKRLKETFSGESQETIAKKLNMTQGNVSKLLSGLQTPTLETIYHVSEAYDVSADWLLGLSDRQQVLKSDNIATYGLVTELMDELGRIGAIERKARGSNHHLIFELIDPLLQQLIEKSNTLSKTDWELYMTWRETKLSLFDDKPIVLSDCWQNGNIQTLMAEASSESNYLEVYEFLKETEAQIVEMMQDNPGPFER